MRLKIRMPLLWKITLSIFLTVFILGSMTVFYVGNRVNTSLFESKKETLNLVSVEQSREINQIMSFARQAADAVPSIPGVVEYMEDSDKKLQDDAILNSLISFGSGRKFLTVFLMDIEGNTWVSVDPTLLNNNFSFRKYFQKAVIGEPASEMVIGSVTNEPGFFFSSPIKNADGEIVGVSVVKMDPKPIYETLTDSYINKIGKFMLVNDDGVIIFANKDNSLYKSLGTMNEDIKAQIETERRYLGRSISALDYDEAQDKIENGLTETFSYEFFDEDDNESELIEVNRVGNFPLFVVTEVSSSAVRNVVASLVSKVIIFIVLVLILGLIVQVIILRRMLKPISKLDEYAKGVTNGNVSESIKIETGDEMQSLALSIEEMVVSLRNFSLGLEEKIREKTKELEDTLKSIEGKNTDLENTKKAVLNVMEDLSEEKDLMANEKSRLETILASIGDGVFVTDKEGKVTLINKTAQEMIGYTSSEVLGKKYRESFNFRKEADIELEYPDFVKKVLDSGIAQSLENHTVIVRRDGVVISVLDSAAPIRDRAGEVYGCVVVFRDNTHERELEKDKDDFLSVTSHQLRTPLGSMRWNLEMLLGGDAGKLSVEAETIAKEVHKGNLRMIDLVNDLLNVNRIDQGRVMDEPAKTDLKKVVIDAASELKFNAEAKKVKINLKLLKTPEITIDPKRFREVIMNLVSNAVKYNRLNGTVDITMKAEKEWIKIMVEDTGIGVPKDDQHRVFNKFFRAKNAVVSETEGSGLGLYVVQKFVEGWGGKISIESKEGKGTKVTLLLPIGKLKQK